MRYSVPVNAADEVPTLAEAGAGELYCGFMDAWWVERYGDHDSASRRQGRANLSTKEELEATVVAAREHGLPIHLALNARYTEPQLDHLVELCRLFEEWGGTGVILSDLGLLWRLREGTGLVRTLSILAVAQNSQTLRAWQSLGVSRCVLPRFMGWDEAASILAAVPGMEASVMGFFDKCPLVDGYCRHRHGVSYPDRKTASEGDEAAKPLYTFDTTYRTHACLGTTCTYLEPYPCAACHLRHFERAGVRTAKLGGRGRPLEERVRAVRFLRSAEGLASDEERSALYQRTFAQPCACYYGSSVQDRHAIQPVAPPSSDGRVRVGSETDQRTYERALEGLCRSDAPLCPDGITLLVPPLSGPQLDDLLRCIPLLVARSRSERPHGPLRIAVNDLGTLVSVAKTAASLLGDLSGGENPRDGEALRAESALPLVTTLGTLLARLDDPVEVTRFLDASQNPSRPVWDLEGRPRTLAYAPPPPSLVRHWQTPSLLEPSAQEALGWLLGVAGEDRPGADCEYGMTGLTGGAGATDL